MNIEDLQEKIKIELKDIDFKNWNKNSIDFLISIFESDKYNSLYNDNLILLNDYIEWYRNNSVQDMYNFNNINKIYFLIKEDIKVNIRDNYVNLLHNIENNKINTYDYYSKYNISYDNMFTILIFLIFLNLLYLIRNIYNTFYIKKPVYLFELKIPLSENITNNFKSSNTSVFERIINLIKNIITKYNIKDGFNFDITSIISKFLN